MSNTPHSDVTTEGLRVQAAAHFLENESDQDLLDYRYGYRITITNVGGEWARLLERHWVVVDAHGEKEEIRGSGVVGENPGLAAGEHFSYQSGCRLRTAWGTMEGTYRFVRDDGRRFDVPIGRFFLVPSISSALHHQGAEGP